MKKPSLRVWYHTISSAKGGDEEFIKIVSDLPVAKRHYTYSRLAELSLIVDTSGAFEGVNDNSEVKKSN